MLTASSILTIGCTSDTATPSATMPTLAAISVASGAAGSTVAETLTGTNFVVGATTVAVSGSGVAVNNVTVTSATSVTAHVRYRGRRGCRRP